MGHFGPGKRLSPRGSQKLSRSPFKRGDPRNAPHIGFAAMLCGQPETASLLEPFPILCIAADSGFHAKAGDRRPCPRAPAPLASACAAAGRSDRRIRTGGIP
jgi:hypothetical protein